jgi:hypothetical protein
MAMTTSNSISVKAPKRRSDLLQTNWVNVSFDIIN